MGCQVGLPLFWLVAYEIDFNCAIRCGRLHGLLGLCYPESIVLERGQAFRPQVLRDLPEETLFPNPDSYAEARLYKRYRLTTTLTAKV